MSKKVKHFHTSQKQQIFPFEKLQPNQIFGIFAGKLQIDLICQWHKNNKKKNLTNIVLSLQAISTPDVQLHTV